MYCFSTETYFQSVIKIKPLFHRFFIDLTYYGIPTEFHPSWINVVRDPVERWISKFYYLRKKRNQTVEKFNLLDCLSNLDNKVNSSLFRNSIFARESCIAAESNVFVVGNGSCLCSIVRFSSAVS